MAERTLTLPENFEHKPGEYPIPIYWAYNNEFNKSIGQDLTPKLGKRVTAAIYSLNERLPEFLWPHTDARAVVITKDYAIVGAWIDKGRHFAFVCSLDRKSFGELTQQDWGEWLVASGVVDPANPVDVALSNMEPKQPITAYYKAIDIQERDMVYALQSRKK